MKKSKLLSKCCGAEVEISLIENKKNIGKRYFCTKCHCICDTIDQPEMQKEEKGEERKWLVFNKQEWLYNPLFKWTEEELDNANDKGFIGTKDGVDCYLARKVEAISTPKEPEEWKEEGIGERRAKINQAINEANKYSVIPMSEDIIIHLTDNLMGVFNNSISTLLQSRDREIEQVVENIEQAKRICQKANGTYKYDVIYDECLAEIKQLLIK